MQTHAAIASLFALTIQLIVDTLSLSCITSFMYTPRQLWGASLCTPRREECLGKHTPTLSLVQCSCSTSEPPRSPEPMWVALEFSIVQWVITLEIQELSTPDKTAMDIQTCPPAWEYYLHLVAAYVEFDGCPTTDSLAWNGCCVLCQKLLQQCDEDLCPPESIVFALKSK